MLKMLSPSGEDTCEEGLLFDHPVKVLFEHITHKHLSKREI